MLIREIFVHGRCMQSCDGERGRRACASASPLQAVASEIAYVARSSAASGGAEPGRFQSTSSVASSNGTSAGNGRHIKYQMRHHSIAHGTTVAYFSSPCSILAAADAHNR